MAYTKTAWANGTTPAINADNLNKIEQGIYDAVSISSKTENSMQQNEYLNLLPLGSKYKSQSGSSVTLTVLNNGLQINGNASGTVYFNLHEKANGMLPGVNAGDSIFIHSSVLPSSANQPDFSVLYLRIRCWTGESSYTDIYYTGTDNYYTVPSGTLSMDVSLRVGSTFNSNVSLYFGIYKKSVATLDDALTVYSITPLYGDYLSFEFNNDNLIITTAYTGSNLFTVIQSNKTYNLTYSDLGARTWTVARGDYLVYKPNSKSIVSLSSAQLSALKEPFAVLANFDTGNIIHGLWADIYEKTILKDDKKDIDAISDYNLIFSNAFNVFDSKTLGDVTVSRIDENRFHIEGTASGSSMVDFYYGSLPYGIVLGYDYYLSAIYDTQLYGTAYFGIRELYSGGAVGTMRRIYFENGSHKSSLKFSLDSNAIGVQITVYYANGTQIKGDFYLCVSSSPNSAILDERVTNVEETLDSLGVESLPDYYYTNNYLPNKLLEINDALNYENGIAFAFITDVHFPQNAYKSRLLLREILAKTNVPFVICGGDIPALFATEGELQEDVDTLISYMNTVGRNNWYAIHGNHDLYNRTNATPTTVYSKTRAEMYNIMMRTSERYITNVLPSHACYSIDIPAQKTRIMMLNSSDQTTGGGAYTNEQIAWILERLTEVENTKFVFVSHIPSDPVLAGAESSVGEDVQAILKAFRNKTSVTISGVVYSFANTTNTMICHINGHLHRDDYNVDNNVLSIVSTCDAAYNEDGEGMVRGTITEQAIDVYFADYDNNIVKTVRVGRGTNRGWNYVEGSVLE